MTKYDCYNILIDHHTWENMTLHEMVNILVISYLKQHGVTRASVQIEPTHRGGMVAHYDSVGIVLDRLADWWDLTWDIEGDTLVMRWDVAKRDQRLEMERQRDRLLGEGGQG